MPLNFFSTLLLICTFTLLSVGCASSTTLDGPATTSQNATPSHEDLGTAYLLGQGVQQNDSQAFYWFQKAADRGSMTAANELGYLYTHGIGVEQNYGEALKWYQKAADAGIASAKYNMGLIYSEGLGTPIDQAKAQAYFRQAAELGFRPAKKRI